MWEVWQNPARLLPYRWGRHTPHWIRCLRWDDAKREIKGGFSFFTDQVGFQELQTALQKIAEVRNCDLADVNFHDSDAFYADVSYAGIIGSLFGSSHMGVSAILVPRENIAK